MILALLSVVVSAAPSAGQAVSFAKAKQWEELYLGFAAASPDGVSKGDKSKIAKALLQGCQALEGEDPVMAFSLGDRSVAFEQSADALYCTALTGKRSDQRGAAEDALQKGVKAYKNDGRFPLELGRLYLEDGQPGEAAAVLGKIGKKAKEWPEAMKLMAQVSKDAPSVGGSKIAVRGGDDAQAAPINSGGGGSVPRGTSTSWESSVDDEGRRIRENQYFRIRYFNAKRDFGQRADYEGAVQGALEDSRVQVARLLGASREKPLDVILYSREEFRMHHGAQAASSVAGFYSEDAIRMNDSAEINDRNRAVLTHEYVHAVMDEVLNFKGRSLPTWMHEGTAEYIEWRYQGMEQPPAPVMKQIKQLAVSGQTPSLKEMSNGMLIASRNPALSYAVSALAVKLLVEKRSMYELVELMKDCGKGTPFATALERRFGVTLERLEEELQSSLKDQ
ncbi:MAG: peptidase MA family metallohydrolase [Archangium sp.]